MHPSVLKYKQAWERQDAALLKECFAHDAIYAYRPREWTSPRPCRGLLEIEAYWKKQVIGEQSNPIFTVLRYVESNHQVWLEWKSESHFPMLLPNEPPFQLWGAMVLDLNEEGKISQLVEYYFSDPDQRGKLEAARKEKANQT